MRTQKFLTLLALAAGPILCAVPVLGYGDFDYDGDGDVDLADAADFVACLDGPGVDATPECTDNHDSDGDLDVDLADFKAFQRAFGRIGAVQVAELTFTGDSFHAVAVDCPSGGCSYYQTPHWLDQNLDGDAEDSGDHKYPVAYIRNTQIGISGLEFGVVPADLELENVPVLGTGPDGMVWEGIGTVSSGVLVVTGTLTSDAPLPNTVVFYDTLDIDWQVALDGANFHPSGTTRNPVYVTYADPMGQRLESYFYISTNAANGQDEEQPVIDAIWDEFADLYVLNAHGEVLGYYRDILCASDCTYYTASALVYYTYSQCGGWADLMIQCLRTQGIGGSQFITIEPRTDGTIPDDCGYTPSPAAGFLVKNYQFTSGDPGPCPTYPFRFNDPCSYYGQWPTPDVTDLPGIPGQDNENPASWFARHFIVKINLQYYDPSYGAGPFTGTTEQATAAWEWGAIAGYWGIAESSTSRLGVRRDVPQIRETFFDQ
jgi:hypothetical protein